MAEIPDTHDELDLDAIEAQIAQRAVKLAIGTPISNEKEPPGSDTDDFGDLDDGDDYSAFAFDDFRSVKSSVGMSPGNEVDVGDFLTDEWDGFSLETEKPSFIDSGIVRGARAHWGSPEHKYGSGNLFRKTWDPNDHDTSTVVFEDSGDSDETARVTRVIDRCINDSTRLEDIENKVEYLTDTMDTFVSDYYEKMQEIDVKLEKIQSMLEMIYSKIMTTD